MGRAASSDVDQLAEPGTLSYVSALTQACRDVECRKAGYCGLMLPVLEDLTLASTRLRASSLLCSSAVCGVGVDCLPVPVPRAEGDGDGAAQRMAAVIRDVATLALRGNKPLTCRLFPVVGKGVGEMTAFDSPYLCNARLLDL